MLGDSGEDMPSIIAMSDVCLVPLKKLGLFRNALPSKMYEYMAASRPIILSLEGEARSLVGKAGAGIAVEPENPREMAEAILKLYHDKELRQRLGRSGQDYVSRYHSRRRIAKKLEELLRNMCGRGAGDR